jgi:NADH-ubiquinone oxidoreductase chain 2
LNAFLILITIGYNLYIYVNNDIKNFKFDKYSPIQFISQLKGLYFVNPILSLSLIITLFSFVGIPPLIGFFGKQMILSAALDSGYIYTTLIAILTSVVSAVYYLVLVKVIFFDEKIYILNNKLFQYITNIYYNIVNKNVDLFLNKEHNEKEISEIRNVANKYLHNNINSENIVISGFLAFTIALITLFILLFIFFDQELVRLIYILL